MKIVSYIDGKLTLENAGEQVAFTFDKDGIEVVEGANIEGGDDGSWILTMEIQANVVTLSDVPSDRAMMSGGATSWECSFRSGCAYEVDCMRELRCVVKQRK